METLGAADLREPGRDGATGAAARAHRPHPERGGEASHLPPDAAGTDDARRLAGKLHRPVCRRIETAPRTVLGGAVQTAGEMEKARDDIFRHRSIGRIPARGRDRDIASPEIAGALVARPGSLLVHPLEPRRPRAQIQRERKRHHGDLGLGQERIPIGPGPAAGRAARQEPIRSRPGPGLADLAIEPPASFQDAKPRVDGLDPRPVGGRDRDQEENADRIVHGGASLRADMVH